MERIRSILNLINDTSYYLNIGEKRVKIRQNELLQKYENSLLFIDYLTDVYFIKSLYEELTSPKFEGKLIVNQKLRKSKKDYYHSLLFFNFFLTELKKCLGEINNSEVEVNFYCRYYERKNNIHFDFFRYDSRFRSDFELYLRNDQDIADVYEKLFALIKETTDSYLKFCLLCILMNKIYQREDTIIRNIDQSLDELEKNLPRIFESIQKILSVDYTSVKYTNESLIKYISPDTLSWLEGIINNKNIVSSLETLSRKEKGRLNCLAIATVGNKSYFSINGLDSNKYDRIREVISEFLEEHHAVVIPDGVRYYLDDEKEFITYKQFKEKSVDKKENRMFTCCERKLFAQMRKENRLNNNVEIIVTSQPCEYCSREINFIQENYNKLLDVIYPREEYVSRHDQIAREIWRDNN